jgi:hypothetical protein
VSAQLGDQWRIAQAERIREAMGSEFCAVADAMRETFPGTKLSWLNTPEIQSGTAPGGEPIGEKAYTGRRRAVTATGEPK